MHKNRIFQFLTAILLVSVLAACSSTAALSSSGIARLLPDRNSSQPAQAAQPTPLVSSPANGASPDVMAAFEGTLENIYSQVNPSVVSIQVAVKQDANAPQFNNPFFGSPGFNGSPNTPQYSQALGSGFVWDNQGHIVTNNHVVDGADHIQVTFADGTILPAKVIGTDPSADLAVIQVEGSGGTLKPVTLADPAQVKVGEMAIAIGNPFGEQGTMTVGVVSALGRSIAASDNQGQGAGYSIPDIIQTDAPINPGNSGGVLVNDQGQVIGVTAAIESPVRASSGIGFAIPASIVQKVVPELIKNGTYKHPYLGVSGTTLTPDLASALKLPEGTRGALVVDLAQGGPADKAGLHGSTRLEMVNGMEVPVGGDVITAIDGQPIKSIDELTAYLYGKTEVGQKIKLSILRDGKAMDLEAVLQARPNPSTASAAAQYPAGSN